MRRHQMPQFLLALICSTLAGAACTSEAQDSGNEPQRVFSVSGQGEARAAPDLAYLTAGVRTQADTAQEALSQNTAAMTQVFNAMKEMGIAERDMQTSDFSVQPVHEPYDRENPRPQRIIAYQVSNQVTITVRDLDKLGSALDQFVSVGANELYGVSFGVEEPQPLLDEARKKAVADARRKAELMAEAAGVRLGRLMNMSESGGGYRPQPAMARMAADAKEASPVPTAAGEQSVEAYVSLTYEIE